MNSNKFAFASKLGLISALLIVFTLGSGISGLQAQKYPFTSNSGKFKITFPAKPEVNTTEKENATTYKTSTQVGDITYFASHTIHEMEMVGPEKLAEISLDAFAETTKGKVSSQKSWKLKKNRGYDAKIALEEQSATIWYKVIIVGQIQYQLVIVAPKAIWDEKSAKKFMKSFKLLK